MIIHKKELPEVDPVELRSLFGLRPGIIILIVLILAILLAFFLLFVLPGIVSKGSYVTFNLNTSSTAIYMDGTYIGSSEGSVYYLPHGEHEFTFSLDGVEAGSVKASIPHRIFFTLFHRGITEIDFTVQGSEELEEALTRHFREEVPLWSRTYEWDQVNHFPPLFSSYASNAKALGFKDVSQVLYENALDITSKEMHQDFLSALDILSSSSVSYESEGLSSLLPVLEGLYGDGERTSVKAGTNGSVDAELYGSFYWYTPQTISMGAEGAFSYPDIIDSPVTLDVGPFAIAARPVSEYDYALFVAENPYWAASNSSELVADGVADSNYLKGVVLSPSIHSSKPVRNISYYAAEAYTAWLRDSTGVNYVIPTEAEWTVAALSASAKSYVKSLSYVDTDTSSPQLMLGGVWEMTSTPFHALSRVTSYEDATAVSSPDIIVKGGSYINSGITIDTVGVMDKGSTSAYTGFRLGIR